MEPFLGEIRIVSFGFAPSGWAACDGQIMGISQNQALFSLLGTTYGGDGITTFALPDFRGRVPLHFSAQYAIGSASGEAQHTLTVNEIPAHTHTVSANSAVPNAPLPTDNVWSAVTQGYASGSNAVMNPAALASTGGQPHENRQPYLALNFIIALDGVWPQRD